VKKLGVVFATLVLALVVSGCSNNVEEIPKGDVTTVDIQNLNKDFPYPLIASSEVKNTTSKIDSISDRSKEFNDLGEMVKLSQAIFEGEVVDVSYFDLKNGPTCTKYAVKISKVLSGNLKKDDVVNVIELGGFTTAYNRIQLYGKEKEFPNISEEDSKKLYVQVNWDGTPLSVVGDKVLLFASKDTQNDWKLPKDYYYAIGYKDGKFNIQGTDVERKVRANDSKKSLEMSEENITNEIKKYMN